MESQIDVFQNPRILNEPNMIHKFKIQLSRWSKASVCVFSTMTFGCWENTDHLHLCAVEDVPTPEEEREGYAWLEKREGPEEIEVVGAEYEGPMFVES